MSGLRITGFNNNAVSPYFRGNDNNKKKGQGIGQPLAGLISPQTPRPPKLPTGIPIPTQPIGGLIKPPTKMPIPLPTVLPPLAGLIPPSVPRNPRIPLTTAGLVLPPEKKTTEEEPKVQEEAEQTKGPEKTEE